MSFGLGCCNSRLPQPRQDSKFALDKAKPTEANRGRWGFQTSRVLLGTKQLFNLRERAHSVATAGPICKTGTISPFLGARSDFYHPRRRRRHLCGNKAGGTHKFYWGGLKNGHQEVITWARKNGRAVRRKDTVC